MKERLISFNGQEKKLGEWAKTLGIHHSSLIERLDAGWILGEALTLLKGGHARSLNDLVKCTKCGKTFPWGPKYFTTNKERPCGCTQPCRICIKFLSRERYKNNRDRVTAQKRELYKRNRDHEIARIRTWQIAHPRKIDLLKKRLESHRRRALEKVQRGILTRVDITLLYKNQRGKCWWCQKPLKHKYEIDHRIPLSKGGTHDRKNIVISCIPCNRSKGNKLPQNWAWRLL